MAYQEPRQDKPALPEYLARKDGGKMDAEEFRSVVSQALQQSVQYVDTELSPERALATDYYLGKPFGNEEDGRSQVVLTEVRDTSDGMLPDILRVAFPPGEHAVEFAPNTAAAVAEAEQKTDYVRYVFEQDNNGFLRAMDVLKDGFVRKIGIFKYGWDDSVSTKSYKQEGISEDALKLLASDETVTLTKGGTTKRPDGLFDVNLTRTAPAGRAWVDSVPPEEFVFNRQARRLDKALLVAHRTDKTRGQLLAMGIKRKDIDDHAGGSPDTDITLKGNAEEIARRDIAGVGRSSGFGYTTDPDMGTANQKILYTEAWMTIDFDGDGIAELRRICTIGTQYYPVKNDPADDIPFAIFTPYPEPHTLIGGSVADRTMDIQRINSSIMRAILDSGAASIFPRTVYLEGQASAADIMNTAIGAPIRERVLNAVRTLDMPFTGAAMLPVLGVMQEISERRTGRSKGSDGLDADALQSTGPEAAKAVINGSQAQTEMLARVFAEMTLKDLFKGLAKLLSAHQSQARMMRLRGQWVEVNPKLWEHDLDVQVNVALGTMHTEKKIATLVSVAADQKELAAATGGMMSPVVSLPKILNTRAKVLALQGIKDFGNYYNELPPNWQPPAPTAPPPDPEALWVQAEKEMNHTKVMKELAIKQDELQLKREEMQWNQQFELRKLASDIAIKKYIADAANAQSASEAELSSRIDEEAREAELAMQGHAMLHDQHLARAQHEHDKAMDVRAADTADTAAAAEPTE